MKNKIRSTISEYPKSFWVMMLGMFIDNLGGNLIYPFFSLYVTAKFDVGFSMVGLVLGAQTAGRMLGGVLGGGLADRYGRKKLMLFGLLVSGLFSTVIIFVNHFYVLFLVAVIAGFLGAMAGPAHQAMLADILPEDKRSSGFGVLRVVYNLTVAIGPLIGGFISDASYNWLFIGDAITSAITFFIVLKLLDETLPERSPEEKEAEAGSDKIGLKGYLQVLKDRDFVMLLGFLMLTFAVMMQMLSTLSVYMRDVQGFPNRYYGYILSLNAIMVVLMQFPVTRQADKMKPFIALAIGAAFSTFGYAMFGFVDGLLPFALAMAILTIGEMVIDPLSETLAAKLAPEDKRGRYMAALNLAVSVSYLATPYMAGLVIDNYDPHWVWYTCGIVGSVAILGYFWLHFRTEKETEM
jgi:MFS family permease